MPSSSGTASSLSSSLSENGRIPGTPSFVFDRRPFFSVRFRPNVMHCSKSLGSMAITVSCWRARLPYRQVPRPSRMIPARLELGSGVLSGRLHDFCFSSMSRRYASCAANLIINRSLARKLWVEVNSLPSRYLRCTVQECGFIDKLSARVMSMASMVM